MVIIETGANPTMFGEMVCEWDENAALLFIRGRVENLMRELLKVFEECGASKLPTESEMRRDLDELTANAYSMFEEYAPEIFKAAQMQLVFDVLLKTMQQFLREATVTDEDHPVTVSMAQFLDWDMRSFRDLQKELSGLVKKKHNELIGIRRGREAQISIEKIIECLRKLPKGAGLARLAAEMDLSQRTIQYALKAAGLTFAQVKRKAKK